MELISEAEQLRRETILKTLFIEMRKLGYATSELAD